MRRKSSQKNAQAAQNLRNRNPRFQKNEQFQIPVPQPDPTITVYKAEEFVLRIPTTQPKQCPHFIYGDNVVRILNKSQTTGQFLVQWQDGAQKTTSGNYLRKYHSQLLQDFEMMMVFRRYIDEYDKKKLDESTYIVIDD